MGSEKWFDRKFDFKFGAERYPDIYQRLAQAPITLKALLSGIPETVLEKNVEGKWSVKEQVGHLSVLEPLWHARLQDIVLRKTTLTSTDLDNRATFEAGFNRYSISLLLDNFSKERNLTLSLMDSIDMTDVNLSALHPRLHQPMRLIDIVYFTAEHDDHHIAVIRNLLNQ